MSIKNITKHSIGRGWLSRFDELSFKTASKNSIYQDTFFISENTNMILNLMI